MYELLEIPVSKTRKSTSWSLGSADSCHHALEIKKTFEPPRSAAYDRRNAAVYCRCSRYFLADEECNFSS